MQHAPRRAAVYNLRHWAQAGDEVMQQCGNRRFGVSFGAWPGRVAALGVLLALAGCVNLKAVGDYASVAGATLADERPALRWRDSEPHLLAWKLDGDDCPIGRLGRPPQAAYQAAFEQVAQVHALLGRYYQVLAQLAGGSTPTPTQALTGSLSAVKAVGVPVSGADEAALQGLAALLGRALDGYRHRELRLLMAATEDDVTRSIALLERLAAIYRDELDGERIQAQGFVRCEIATRALGDGYLGRRELKRVADAYAADQQTLARYAGALAKVRADHAAIREALAFDRDRLEQTLGAIADTRIELETARAALNRL